MVFSSLLFLFVFLPIFLGIYYLCPRKYRNGILFVFSLLFYAWGEPIYVGIMIFSTFFDYSIGLIIDKYREDKKIPKIALIASVCVNLGLLGFFKYSGFFIDNLNNIFNLNINVLKIALPIGISFYTFQTMSYTIDLYREKIGVQKNIISFGAYVAMFPQLIAGPIVTYSHVEKEINERKETIDKFGYGVSRFIEGLGKKVIIANNVGMLWDTIISSGSGISSVTLHWIGMIAFGLQLYFDFSGYSDMAIGLGSMMGFSFPENFNYPYISKSVTEFWRRWHISLSSWFREYLYIPLGGNRVTVTRHIINLLIVWSLTGLWHGASWNFIIWGLYYGVILVLEKYVYGKYLENIKDVMKHIYTLLIVIIGWVFFSSSDLGAAAAYLKNMFALGSLDFFNIKTAYLLKTNVILLVIGWLVALRKPLESYEKLSMKYPVLGVIFTFGIFIISISYLVFNSYNPFLYFRF